MNNKNSNKYIKKLFTKSFWVTYLGITFFFLVEDSILVGLARFTDVSFILLLGVIIFTSLFATFWSVRGNNNEQK